MSDLAMTLKQRWLDQMNALGQSPNEPVIDKLLAAYAEPHRRYHGLTHLEYIFAEIDRMAGEFREPGRVWLAAWFHDAIYNTKAKDNEVRSARLAHEELAGLALADGLVDRVTALIEATASHQDGGSDHDDDLFLDIDFSILGAPPEIYDRYAEGVREEYGWAPGLLYRQGRRAFLKSARKAPRIFLTDHYESRLGDQARENMRRELELL